MKRLIPFVLAGAIVGCAAPMTTPQASPTPNVTPSAIAPTPAPSPSQASTFTVSGKVFDDDINGIVATISATSPGKEAINVESGTDGSYSLRLAPGAYTVTASKPGWTTRAQSITVKGDTALNFGGINDTEANPHFLSNWAEVTNVGIKEERPGGPLTITLNFSEALSAENRDRLVSRLDVLAGTSTSFVSAGSAPEAYLRAATAWDAEGRVLTLTYAEPYLASSATGAVSYSLRFRQGQLNEIDPETNFPKWDNLNITDAQGLPFAANRADFAFLKPELFPITFLQLGDKTWGKDHKERRWALTHQSTHTFVASQDLQGAGLESAKVFVERTQGTEVFDAMELRMTEPMRVVKDAIDNQYTRLDKDKQLVIVSMSKLTSGASPTALGSSIKVQRVMFSRTEANLVTLLYPAGTFKDQKWVEVTLGADALDPAGNRPDQAKIKAVGTVS